jgi:hypothetical protein
MSAKVRCKSCLFACILPIAAWCAPSLAIAQAGGFSGSVLSALIFSASGQEAGCRPGDLEIGRQETPDEIIVYCSRVSCQQINQRVLQDMDAQRTLQRSIEESNTDLKEWAQRNEAAQQAALKAVTDALLKSAQAFSAERVDLKIARLQDELNRRAQGGETISTRLEKVGALSSAYAGWSGISDSLKLVVTPGIGAADTWVELQKWLAQAGKESASLSAAWAAVRDDAELRQILGDESLDQSFDLLKQGLKPVLTGSFDMAKFLVDYGYSASTWQVAKLQILQRDAQGDANLMADCKLDRLLKIDERNMNVCNGRLPDPNADDPQAIRCAAAH